MCAESLQEPLFYPNSTHHPHSESEFTYGGLWKSNNSSSIGMRKWNIPHGPCVRHGYQLREKIYEPKYKDVTTKPKLNNNYSSSSCNSNSSRGKKKTTLIINYVITKDFFEIPLLYCCRVSCPLTQILYMVCRRWVFFRYLLRVLRIPSPHHSLSVCMVANYSNYPGRISTNIGLVHLSTKNRLHMRP